MLRDELERMIDRNSLAEVLDALRGVYYDKAEHMETVYQDRLLACAWRQMAGRIETVTTAAEHKGFNR